MHAKATLAYYDAPPAPAAEPAAAGEGEGEGGGPPPAPRGGGGIAFLGSANLVRGSMNLPVHCGLLPYDELNVRAAHAPRARVWAYASPHVHGTCTACTQVLVREPAFCDALGASMDSLFGRARRVREGEDLLGAAEWYSERRAMWEELWQ